MKGLTAKQQAIWDLKRPVNEGGQGKTTAEAAAILGISGNVVTKTMTVIHKKLGLNAMQRKAEAQLVENTRPEQAAALMDAATEPFANIKEAIAASGLPERTGEAFLRRLRTRHLNAVTPVRAIKSNEMQERMAEKVDLALSYMDDKVMSEASFRDLALGTTAIIEKIQLLKGEPTQIISDHERKKLHELIPLMIAEAQRRGITIEGQLVDAESKVSSG